MNKQLIFRYAFAGVSLLAGLLLSYFQVGEEFLGFASVGNWLIYVGFVMLIVITLQFQSKKKRVVDERMHFIAYKASRLTFVAIILAAFIIMVIDGIHPIQTAYAYMMSYFICGIVFVYFITYKILLKYN